MKSVYIISFLLSLVNVHSQVTGTKFFSVQKLNPNGFRIKMNILNDPSLKLATMCSMNELYTVFNVNINRPIGEERNADLIARINEQSAEGEWIYENSNIGFENVWKIEYRVDLYCTGQKLEQESIYGSAQLSGPIFDDKTPHFNDEKCKKSVTTVERQSVCEGKLIFEEHFDSLDPKFWKIDARIPANAYGYPFVSFQNDPEIVYTQNSVLYIKPKFLWKTPGYNESTIKTGTLEIDGCLGEENECIQKAKSAPILPPIISARIATKHSFSFRYGKIVIRAKMPKGDWIMPMLFLEPLENYYGPSNYASGAIRIASVRGNPILQTSNGNDISNHYLSGGVVLENGGHEDSLKHYSSETMISSDFHNFTLIWTEEEITVGIDDHIYGRYEGGFSKLLHKKSLREKPWDSESIMAPFDREFYLTIGLSVGGHVDFPDFSGKPGVLKPWDNLHPKAMLKFFNDRQNWMDSWKSSSSLQVDFILVYAL